jgi:CRP-like cAMP-binding protein
MRAAGPKTQPGLETALASFPLFMGLDPETLGRLASVGRICTWSAGSCIFQREDEGDHMIAVTVGRIRLSISTPQGRELVLCHLFPGDILGELALIDGRPRSADAFAVERSTGIVIDRAGFLDVAREKADLPLALARHLSGLLRNTNFQMETIALYDLRQRVARFFLFSLHQTHGEELPERPTIRYGLSQTELSAVLGASRPKVNRVLQDMIAEGALTREGTRLCCDAEALRSIAETDISLRSLPRIEQNRKLHR